MLCKNRTVTGSLFIPLLIFGCLLQILGVYFAKIISGFTSCIFQLHLKIFNTILVASFLLSRMTVIHFCVFLMLGFLTSGL